jgi:glutathione S-transferase
MMSEVVVYGAPTRSSTWSVRWLLTEKGVDYRLVDDPSATPTDVQQHPFSKTPALRHGDRLIFGGRTILRYASDAFDGTPATPADVAQRAHVDMWMTATEECLYRDVITHIVLPRVVLPKRGIPANERSIADAVTRVRRRLPMFEDALIAGPWLAGRHMSIADLYLAPIMLALGTATEGATLLEDFPGLMAWSERLRSRPAYLATVPDED